MEDITDERYYRYMENITDYVHEKRVSKDSKIKNVAECHDKYVQSKTLLLPGLFENFQKNFPEIYELDPACFFIAPV